MNSSQGANDGPSSTRNEQYCVVCDLFGTNYLRNSRVCRTCYNFFNKNKYPQLECSYRGNCVLTPSTQSKCLLCRTDKSFDAETYANGQHGPTVGTQDLPIQKTYSSQFFIKAKRIVENHEKSCFYTIKKMEEFKIKPMKREEKIDTGETIQRLNQWSQYATILVTDFEAASTFIQELEYRLNPVDKRTMLKRKAFPIYLLRTIRAFSADGLLLHDGTFLDLKTLKCLYGDKLVDEIVAFANFMVTELECSDADIAHFIPLVLYEPVDTLGPFLISSYMKLKNLKETYLLYKLNFLKYCNNSQKYEVFFNSVMPKLSEMSFLHENQLEFLREHHFWFSDETFKTIYDIEEPTVPVKHVIETRRACSFQKRTPLKQTSPITNLIDQN